MCLKAETFIYDKMKSLIRLQNENYVSENVYMMNESAVTVTFLFLIVFLFYFSQQYCRHCGDSFCSRCCSKRVKRAVFGATGRVFG